MPAPSSARPSAARAQASKARLNPLWYHYACAVLLAAIFVGNGLRWLFLDWTDPYHCGSLLNKGQWMDPGTYKLWQPEGCYHAPLKHDAYFSCLTTPTVNTPTAISQKRQVLFIGDSAVRQLFFGFVRLVDGGKGAVPSEWESNGEKHSDRKLTFYQDAGKANEMSLELQFWWDPYLNNSKTVIQLGTIFPDPPSLMVLGSGLWYLRNPSSGGLGAWGKMIQRTFDDLMISQGSPKTALQSPWNDMEHGSGVPFGLLPSNSRSLIGSRRLDIHERNQEEMDSTRITRFKSSKKKSGFGLSDGIIFLPIVNAVESLLSPPRAETIIHEDIEAMNADLLARLTHPSPPPIIIPTVFNNMLVEEETKDGLHFSDKIMDKQAELLLAWRCNDVVGKQAPQGSCCKRNYWTRPVQAAVILFFTVWAPFALFFGARIPATSRIATVIPRPTLAAALSSFGIAIGYLFFADRTSMFFKENKVYDTTVFASLSIIFLIAGVATVKSAGKDQGYLNRDITDEWKGWMQIAILIYHFFGASKVSGIYNPVRVLVAAYLFMTGYGHFFFYYKKADFGFDRVAAVLVRLNLLSVVLPYTMNTDYAFYYFAPLVSFWYLIIYATMAIGSRYNEKALFLLPKLLLCAGLITLFMQFTWIMEEIFNILNMVFKIQWSGKECSFRITLDLFIVWAGMLTAYAYIKIKEYQIPDKPYFERLKMSTLVLSGFGLIWYFCFELKYDKFQYNTLHPYISFIPILSFVCLRNANPLLRTYTSKLFCFIGQCSLETFILQFHGWLGSDTKSILLVLPATKWRPLNLLISTIAFIWLSHRVAGATGDITEWLVGKKKNLPLPATSGQAIFDAGKEGANVSEMAETGGAKQIVEGSKEGARSGVEESIPLMNQEEKELNEELKETPAASEDTLGSVPNWMSATARRLTRQPSVHEFETTKTKWKDETVSHFIQNIGSLAEKHNSVRLGLVLLALWVLNWIY